MSAATPAVPDRSAQEWAAYRERIEAAARQAHQARRAGQAGRTGARPGDG